MSSVNMSTKKRHCGVPHPFHTIGSGECGDGEPGEIEVVGKWVYVLPPRGCSRQGAVMRDGNKVQAVREQTYRARAEGTRFSHLLACEP